MDNHNIDFKNIWQQQNGDQPDLKALRSKIISFKKSNLRKLLLCNILLVVASIFIVFIWYYYQPQFITTKIGIVITILAMIIFILSYNDLYSYYKKIDSSQSSNDYLENLILIKTKQKTLQTKTITVYFILLSLGICLYLYEYTRMMSMFWGIFAYTITLAWIALNWFFIKPKTVKKQNIKIDSLIEKVTLMKEQLE